MSRASVRTHTRRIPGVGTVTVQRHNRSQRGGAGRRNERGMLRPRRGWRMVKRGVKAARRHKRATAAVCLTLGCTEIVAWLGLRGLSSATAMVGLAAFAVGAGVFAIGRAAHYNASQAGGESR